MRDGVVMTCRCSVKFKIENRVYSGIFVLTRVHIFEPFESVKDEKYIEMFLIVSRHSKLSLSRLSNVNRR